MSIMRGRPSPALVVLPPLKPSDGLLISSISSGVYLFTSYYKRITMSHMAGVEATHATAHTPQDAVLGLPITDGSLFGQVNPADSRARKRPPLLSSEELEGLKVRDEATWETVITRISPRLTRFARRFTASEEDAEDAVQRSLCRLYEVVGTVGEENPSGFITTMVRNASLDRARQTNKQSQREQPLEMQLRGNGGVEEAADILYPDLGVSVENGVVNNETRAFLRDTMPSILLMWADGYTYEEIAQAFKVKVGTVKSRLSRQKEKVRAVYGDELARDFRGVTSSIEENNQIYPLDASVIETKNPAQDGEVGSQQPTIIDIIPDFDEKLLQNLSGSEYKAAQMRQAGIPESEIARSFGFSRSSGRRRLSSARKKIEMRILLPYGIKRVASYKGINEKAMEEGRLPILRILGMRYSMDAWVEQYIASKRVLERTELEMEGRILLTDLSHAEYGQLIKARNRPLLVREKNRWFISIANLQQFRSSYNPRPNKEASLGKMPLVRVAKTQAEYLTLYRAIQLGELRAEYDPAKKTYHSTFEAVDEFYRQRREKMMRKNSSKNRQQSPEVVVFVH